MGRRDKWTERRDGVGRQWWEAAGEIDGKTTTRNAVVSQYRLFAHRKNVTKLLVKILNNSDIKIK